VAFGSEFSNYCTDSVMVALGFPSILVNSAGTAYEILRLAALANPTGFEYGVIAVTNVNGRLAIACWGLGENGTAGAAHFMANRGRQLRRALDNDLDTDFLALLKFPIGQETNGQLVRVYRPNNIHTFGLVL
jgi:hypothetical protein